ncbi:MAG: sigma-70 family RNA polymerase sigma factor [Parabacteroides sp.]|nr:sigma-70 family RNA polymerase sigma factor [Parabacteroides sp.]
MRREKEEDNTRIDTLYRTHVHDLFSYALHLGFDRETCQDAIHDVFCKLCTGKEQLDTVKNIRFYLLRALKNRLLDLYKQKKGISELSLDTIPDELPFTVRVTVEDELIRSEEEKQMRDTVANLLGSLSERQREIIYLRYTQKCDYEEIA